jgi:hypothetical protein
MNTDRESVVDALRLQGEHDRAFQASCALPPHIDTEKDAGLLSQLGLTPGSVEMQSISP